MGTPIKNRNNEMKLGGHGTVHSYKLSPKELEAYRAMPAGEGWKMPVRMRMTKAEAERRKRREGNQNEPCRDSGDSGANRN